MSDQSRRKLLKSIAAGSGAIIAGKSLPESWSKPVVDSVMLPAHAQTSVVPPVEPTVFTQTLGFNYAAGGAIGGTMLTETFDFNLGSLVPTGDGTITISNLAGDLNSDPGERWTIEVGAATVGVTDLPGECVAPVSMAPITVTLAELQAALSGGIITVSAVNGGSIQDFCDQIYGCYAVLPSKLILNTSTYHKPPK